MDLQEALLWVLAGVGAMTILILILGWLFDWFDDNNGSYTPGREIEVPNSSLVRTVTDSIADIRSEVLEDFKRKRFTNAPTDEPTLKAKVDAIMKHLDIEVETKPAQPQKVVVKKGKK